MKSNDIKRFFKDKMNLSIRVRTIPCKAKWIEVWIPSEPYTGGNVVIYKHSIPLEFRQLCLRIIYPNSPELAVKGSAGNVKPHSISMIPSQWEEALKWAPVQPTA